MGDDWADEEVPMDNIEQVFLEISQTYSQDLDGLWRMLITNISANNHDGRAARGQALWKVALWGCAGGTPNISWLKLHNYWLRCLTCHCKTTSLWRRSTPSTSPILLEGLSLYRILPLPMECFFMHIFLASQWVHDLPPIIGNVFGWKHQQSVSNTGTAFKMP